MEVMRDKLKVERERAKGGRRSGGEFRVKRGESP